jgi:hypothetical protein
MGLNYSLGRRKCLKGIIRYQCHLQSYECNSFIGLNYSLRTEESVSFIISSIQNDILVVGVVLFVVYDLI